MQSQAQATGVLSPEGATQAAQGLEQAKMEYGLLSGKYDPYAKVETKSPYENVQVDAFGQYWGFNKDKGQVEQMPQQKPFGKAYTVQGATPEGIPTQEIVFPGSMQAPTEGRITLGTKVPVPSAEEAKKEAQTIMGVSMLDEMNSLVEGKHPEFPGQKVDIGPGTSGYRKWKAGTGLLGEFGALVTPGKISGGEGRLLALEESLGNQMLAAFRGANVGPEEQEKFERQLPRSGQNPELFKQNMILTRKNLAELYSRSSKLRGRKGEMLPPIPTNIGGGNLPPGFQLER